MKARRRITATVAALMAISMLGTARAQDEGLLPVPDYAGDLWTRARLTGDWGDLRQDWAERGITMTVDWYQSYQDLVNGGRTDTSASSANLDYRLNLDLMRMGVVPGALVSVRGQSRFGDTVNGASGLLLPVNTYSSVPLTSDPGAEVDIAVTELNWTQFLSDKVGLLAGKITTLATANEFLGGEGRSQFMNFQLSFPAVVAQVSPYSTLAVGALGMPNPDWTVSTFLMNLEDASTSSGFDDIGDGTTWATTIDYLGSVKELPGGWSLGMYYAFDAEFGKVDGLNIDPGSGEISMSTESEAWALSWGGWQYLLAEQGAETVDPRNGRQDLQGLGLSVMAGLADDDTNPVSWALAFALSGRGSIPGRDDDTWGAGYFYNDLQDLDLSAAIALDNSTQGLEVYYDIQIFKSTSLTLDAQWTESAVASVADATILGARLNVAF